MKKRTIFDRITHRSLSSVVQSLNRLLCTLGLIRPKVVIYIDGGICSQMQMYLCGEKYRKAGLDVVYDTLWYEENGKDYDCKFERKLELQQLFPGMPFVTLTSRQCKRYRYLFSVKNADNVLPDPEDIRQTSYLGGYYHLFPTEEYKEMFNGCFNARNRCEIETRIPEPPNNGTNCAVHVRRGDLANRDDAFYKANPWYHRIPDSYFYDVIKYISEHYPEAHFYFFSDEPEWVKENLIPNVKAPCQLVQGNKAYEDLILISECDVVVSSNGSFGKMAARLHGSSDLFLPAFETELGFLIKNFSKEVF